MEELKQVKEVFADYKEDVDIQNAQIKSMNFFNKTGTLEVELEIAEAVEFASIAGFEAYLRSKLGVKEVKINVGVDALGNPKYIGRFFFEQFVLRDELLKR